MSTKIIKNSLNAAATAIAAWKKIIGEYRAWYDGALIGVDNQIRYRFDGVVEVAQIDAKNGQFRVFLCQEGEFTWWVKPADNEDYTIEITPRDSGPTIGDYIYIDADTLWPEEMAALRAQSVSPSSRASKASKGIPAQPKLSELEQRIKQLLADLATATETEKRNELAEKLAAALQEQAAAKAAREAAKQAKAKEEAERLAAEQATWQQRIDARRAELSEQIAQLDARRVELTEADEPDVAELRSLNAQIKALRSELSDEAVERFLREADQPQPTEPVLGSEEFAALAPVEAMALVGGLSLSASNALPLDIYSEMTVDPAEVKPAEVKPKASRRNRSKQEAVAA